jgi:hypothetical protein
MSQTPSDPQPDNLLTLRQMARNAAFYHAALVFMLVASFILNPWQHAFDMLFIAILAWVANGYLAAWAFDKRHKD